MYGYIQSPQSHKDWVYGAIVQGMDLPSKSNNYVPKVVSQGNFGTCVAHAAYYVKCSQEAKDSLAEVSRLMIYQQCKEIDGLPVGTEGTTPLAAMQVLTKTGVCLESTFPYSLMGTDARYTQSMVQEASKYKISGYAKCYTIDDIKLALYKSGALIIGVPVGESFRNINTKWVQSVWGGAILGGHALCILNYDDEAVNPLTGEKGAVQIINSWGESWGEKGIIWLSYSQLMTKTDLGMSWLMECFSSVDIQTGFLGTKIELQIGNHSMYVNGIEKQLDQEPFVIAATGRTVIPLRAPFEAIGCKVEWIPNGQKIIITKQ